MIIDSRDVYSQHKFDIGQTKQKFHVTLQPISELRKQRPSKCPLHLKHKLEKLLGQLQDSGIIREMGDEDELGSLLGDPIILLPKADYVKLVIDAGYPNSITDLTNYSVTRAGSDDHDSDDWQILHSKRPFMRLSPSPSIS